MTTNTFAFGAQFGAASAAPAGSAPGGFAFGATPAATSSAQAPTATPFGFGAVGTSAQASAAMPALGIPASAPASSAPALGGAATFSLGATSAPAASAAPTFGMAAPASALGAMPSAAAPATSVAAAPVTMQTKFKDLPQAIKDQVMALNNLIKEQTAMSDSLSTMDMGSTLRSFTDDVAHVRRMHGSVALLLEADLQATHDLRALIRKEVARAEAVSRSLQADTNGRTSSGVNPIAYFHEQTKAMSNRATDLTQRVADLEAHVQSILQAQPPSPAAVAETMRAQHDSFVLLASQAAQLHASVDRLREQYAMYRREHLGDSRNPFAKSTTTTPNDARASLMASGRKRPSAEVFDPRASYASEFIEPGSAVAIQQPSAAAAPALAAPATSAGFALGGVSVAAPAAAKRLNFGFGGFGAK